MSSAAVAEYQPRTDRPNAVLALFGWAIAVTAPCFAFLPPEASYVGSGWVLFLSLTILVYSAGRLAVLVAKTDLRIVSGIVYVFFYVSLGVVPLAQLQTELYPRLHSFSYVATAQLLALGALLSFDVGQRWMKKQSLRLARHAERPPAGISASRLWLLTGFALLGAANYVRTVGVSALFGSRAEAGEVLAALSDSGDATRAFVNALGTVPVLVAFVAWTVLIVRRRRNGIPITLGPLLAWLALLAANLAVNNFISNSRYWFLTVLAGIFFSLPGLSARLFRVVLVVGVITALVLFPQADYFRLSAADRASAANGTVAEQLAGKDYDQATMTANGVWYVDREGHTFGRQLTGVALFWLPRAVWADKPIDTGVLIGRELRNTGTTNLSSPIYLEFWMDFGWAGMLALMAGVGALVGSLDARFALRVDRQRAKPYIVDILVPLLAGFTFILMRGPLLQATGRLVILLAVCWFLTERMRDRRSATDAPARTALGSASRPALTKPDRST